METTSPSHIFEHLLDELWLSKMKDVMEYMSDLENRINQLEIQRNKSFLTQKEVISNFNIGHRTLKKWVAEGLTEIWIDNRVYYDRKDIEEFIDHHKY